MIPDLRRSASRTSLKDKRGSQTNLEEEWGSQTSLKEKRQSQTDLEEEW